MLTQAFQSRKFKGLAKNMSHKSKYSSHNRMNIGYVIKLCFRNSAIYFVTALSLLIPINSNAQGYPNKPIKLVVPFAPSGGTDVIARPFAKVLGEKLGVSIIIDNRPGAAGTVGADYVAKAAPDGYTLLIYHIAMITSHHLQKNMGYDALKDFTPISIICNATNVIAITATNPIKTFQELVAEAKKKPGSINFGTSGAGGSDHLGGQLLQIITNTEMSHIPFKGGGPANVAAASGDIQITTGTLAQASSLIRAGKLRGLVVMQKDRSPAMPEIPSAIEAGYPTLIHPSWFGIWGPAKLPNDVTQKLSLAIKETLESTEVKQAFSQIGADPMWMTPPQFANFNEQEYNRWNSVLKGKFIDK
jgi:tripartite-type tricarboxylate transporter receptor subunit TctC